MNLPRTVRTYLSIPAILLAFAGCTFGIQPALPSSADPAAISERITNPGGRVFLRKIISTSWNDNGRRAAELFAWVPRDSRSPDQATAARAGNTAHALMSFLADEQEDLSTAPANPALWQAFAQSIVPYLGAMVGDNSEVAGFAPLDPPDSAMHRSATLFVTLTKDTDAGRILTDATVARAHGYEAAFAKTAVANPLLADRAAAQKDMLCAARLRGLAAINTHLSNPGSHDFTLARAQTELGYQVATLTARPGDPHIDDRFFQAGRLLPPNRVSAADWSIYDAQLTVYLSSWPAVNKAIEQFGHAYDVIVRQ